RPPVLESGTCQSRWTRRTRRARRPLRGADDVLERHVEDRGRNQRLDERREPERVRREIVRRREQRGRMRHREGGDDADQRAEAAERDDETEEKQQVIDAVEDVTESQADEAERRLMPAWIQLHQTRIAVQIERADRAAWEYEPQRGDRSEPEPVQA